MVEELDAVVVGAGPNGLAAAITLAEAGLRVLVLEAADRPGGGCRTSELTLPGFRHDVCSAAHPLAVASPFFARLPLARHGLAWVSPEAPLAHPLAEGQVALLEQSLPRTMARLAGDGALWERLLGPFVRGWELLLGDILGPLRWPRHPLLLARFGRRAVNSCRSVATRFQSEAARALFAGCAAHSFLPLDRSGSAAFGLVLAVAAQTVGWPFPRSGADQIIAALAAHARELGVVLQCGLPIRAWRQIPPARAVLFDLAPRQVAAIAEAHLPTGFLQRLRAYRYGPGVFKLDWALAAPIPWRNPETARAGTVHVGGTFEEIAEAEQAVWKGAAPERPFVLVGQPAGFDPTRAPRGRHIGWGYCHVPAGCAIDMTGRVEEQIERFAPGFRDLILARHARGPAGFEQYNPNFIGGDISGGANTLRQLLFRPTPRWDPYATPNPRLFLCSASTPPGGGVHGMCGYWAARSALRKRFARQ